MSGIRIALTLDDAPSIAESGLATDPTHMDAIRRTLKSLEVSRCVAFVVASTAAGHEAMLERWLADGYELGNHTFEHTCARNAGVSQVMQSITRCHELLAKVGAFSDGRTKWFRFPFLSRGRDAAARDAIQSECAAMGYRLAHASVDLFDHAFEHRFEVATRRGDTRAVTAIAARYEDVALDSLHFAARRMERVLGRIPPLVPYCHFGSLSRRQIGGILSRMHVEKMQLCSLEEAMDDSLYRQFDQDPTRDGLVTPGMRPLPLRVTRALALTSELVGVANQGRLGPRWPYLR